MPKMTIISVKPREGNAEGSLKYNPVEIIEGLSQVGYTYNMRFTKKCVICNKSFFPKDDRRETCSNKCRQLFYIKNRHSKLPAITEEQEQVILGTLLGDGYLLRQSLYGTHILCLEHSIKQKAFLEWKMEKLGSLKGCIDERQRYDKRTNKVYGLIRGKSKVHPIFSELKKEYYRGKKVIRRKFLNRLTALGLATWFMDDGHGSHRRYVAKSGKRGIARYAEISLGDVSEREAITVKKYFRTMLNIETKLYKNGKNCFILRFNSTEFKKLVQIIGEYIIPEMRYKIELWEDNTFIPSYNIVPLQRVKT